MLIKTLRRLGLEETKSARASYAMTRLKTLKMRALVKVSARRIWASPESSYSNQELFMKVWEKRTRQVE